jgi:ribonuclease D
MSEFDWISDQREFDALLAELTEVDAYALDTEFHRERTFLPVLALTQVATADRIALVDTLSVDVRGFRDVFAGNATCVMHAASQDLEILELACGAVPSRLFDTQIAALFCGYRTSSLAKLVEGFVGRPLDKSSQLTDWTRRPLPQADLTYAASDVAHLLELRDAIVRTLEERERLDWAGEEIERLRTKDRSPAEPETLWWKLRGKSKLHGRARGVAQELAAWRYEQAKRVNRPVKSVLSDMALLALAQRPPKNAGQLKGIRNFDSRHFKHADAILDAVRRGISLPREALRMPPKKPENAPSVDGVIALCLAWLAQRASEEDLDMTVLATRDEVTARVLGQPSRLDAGWRRELVGTELDSIIDGSAALRVDGTKLALIDRTEGRSALD